MTNAASGDFMMWLDALAGTVQDADAALSRRKRRSLRLERRAVLMSEILWEAHRAAMSARRHIRCSWWRRKIAGCPEHLCDREPFTYR